MERLDAVVGPGAWSVSYRTTPSGVICRLTILGVTREDVGDFPIDPDDPNKMTSAAMQAYKRTCATFGLGRYLYSLPQSWFNYSPDKRAFADPAGVVHTIYELAGQAPAAHIPPDPKRLETARTALKQAETKTNQPRADGRTPPPVPDRASDPQLGLIARLMVEMQRGDEEEAEAAAEAIDALGDALKIDDLSVLTTRDHLRRLGFSKSSSLSERSEKSAPQWDYASHCIILSDALETVLSDRLLAPTKLIEKLKALQADVAALVA
jgi:hypothetical protein